jgi:hypothetical protein
LEVGNPAGFSGRVAGSEVDFGEVDSGVVLRDDAVVDLHFDWLAEDEQVG